MGDRVAIGAISNTGVNGYASGHTRIYQLNGSSWEPMGEIDGEAAVDHSGYSVSLNALGDRVAIGAIANDAKGSNSGHTRIYQWNESSWDQLGLDIDGEAALDNSGCSVSLNALGDRVAIGAIYNGANGINSGHTRIYQLTGTTWTQMGLDINGKAPSNYSGSSVSLNALGDRVAIGAIHAADAKGYNSGNTIIYQWNGSSWTQLGSNIDGEAVNDNYGYSVSLNALGDRVAIGATNNNGNGVYSGHTRIYKQEFYVQIGSYILYLHT